MRCATLALAVVVAALAVGVAHADPDRVVFGPVAGDATVPAELVAKVGAALAGGAKPIEPACAAVPACVATTATALGAKVAVIVTVRAAGKDGVALELALVDTAHQELVGRRAIAIPEARLAAALPAAVTKFVDEEPTDRAKELFTEGNEHYNLGEFAKALPLYKQAYRVKPLPAFLFNIAQCHRKLGQHVEAIAMYQSYLAGVPDASNRKLVEDLIAESKTAAAAAQIEADKRAAVALEAAKVAAAKKAVEDARLAKEAEARTAQHRAEQARLEAEVYDRHPARLYAYLGAGVAGGALIAGSVFGTLARGHQTSFDGAGCGDPAQPLGEVALAKCVDDRDRGKRDALAGNVLMAAGGAALIAAAIVFVIDPGNVARPGATTTALVVAPTSFALEVHW
jgi:tetratricopeptide (TPR) repeat protein